MKSKKFSISLIILGILFILYDIISLCLVPGTFIDTIRAFSNVWLIPGLFLIFCGIYELKNKRLFLSIWKKWLKIVFYSCIGIAIFISAINLTRMNKAVWADENLNPDYVILLGGGIDKNGNLPESVKNRAETTARYLLKHQKAICVVSGGRRDYQIYPEAPALKKYLVEKGISENRIFVDDKALDTIQNLENSAELFAEYDNCELSDVLQKKTVVLASGKFHIARAERIAKRMGFEKVYGIGAKVPFINILNSYAREILSYVKLDLRILLTGKPSSIL